MSAVIAAAVTSLSNEMVYDDTAGMIAYLDAQERAKAGPVGCVGYCMSGPFALTVLARFPHRMRAGASMYGVKMVTDQPDSPHLRVADIKGEAYIAFAEHDPAVPDHVPGELRAALDKARTRYTMETVPGASHGFVSPERRDYQPSGAEDTWAKIFALWERNLKR
jgi:carboxymethylenebutenolidase